VDFYGRWMPDPPEVYRVFLGEYGWSPAFRYFQQQHFHDLGDNGWTQPAHDCPLKVRSIAFEYLREAGIYDCSIDKTYRLRLPANEIVTSLKLQWSGNGADYVDAAGQLAVFNPTAHDDGPQALLFNEDCLREFLKQERLSLCWTILGEKLAVGPGFDDVLGILRLSGAYILGKSGPAGFTKCIVDDR